MSAPGAIRPACSTRKAFGCLPYLNSLNWLQVALLKQLRETQYEDEHAFTETLHLVHLTINGIAQGLRNTG